MTSVKPYILGVFILLIFQFFFWNNFSRSIKTEFEITPAVPSEEIFKAFSFGDDQSSFRYYGYKLQFVGDLFGRVTPLKDYDYAKLYKWWGLLDNVDFHSDLVVHMVAYYFSATQTPKKQVPYVVKFLEEHSDKNPPKNWWWYAQAVYNARYKANDDKSALRIAHKLESLPKDLDIPIWTRQLSAFIYEKRGEFQPACDIILNVVNDYAKKKLNDGEINYMYYFITERLDKMLEAEKKKGKLNISPECQRLLEVRKATDLRNFTN